MTEQYRTKVPVQTCTRILEFDAGHRLLAHEGKCAHLHGHRYKAEVTCEADQLDNVGRVIDFSVIKEKLGVWIDMYLDHNMILNQKDGLREYLENTDQRPPFLMPEGYGEPTAENIARLLFCTGNTLFKPDGVRVIHVKLWETPNCYAEYSIKNDTEGNCEKLVNQLEGRVSSLERFESNYQEEQMGDDL